MPKGYQLVIGRGRMGPLFCQVLSRRFYFFFCWTRWEVLNRTGGPTKIFYANVSLRVSPDDVCPADTPFRTARYLRTSEPNLNEESTGRYFRQLGLTINR